MTTDSTKYGLLQEAVRHLIKLRRYNDATGIVLEAQALRNPQDVLVPVLKELNEGPPQ